MKFFYFSIFMYSFFCMAQKIEFLDVDAIPQRLKGVKFVDISINNANLNLESPSSLQIKLARLPLIPEKILSSAFYVSYAFNTSRSSFYLKFPLHTAFTLNNGIELFEMSLLSLASKELLNFSASPRQICPSQLSAFPSNGYSTADFDQLLVESGTKLILTRNIFLHTNTNETAFGTLQYICIYE
ncbi:MAG: hypothetical protein QE271_02825 [Bacteriovoracaceae bacterium]|nr:hypothetical protein [Bacteriovoracaceae bacterium]